ncbi:MAG: hypothetical protein WDN03_15595 [Rhizomicrobium sp.]
MKASWFAVAALLMASAASAQPSPEPAPQVLALAQRYLAATGGTYEMLEQQAYVAGGVMGDSLASHARQQALQAATGQHRAELEALDVKLASLMAQTFTVGELLVAVNFLESPVGRSITQTRHVYFAAMFAPDRPPLTFTPEQAAALTAYAETPEAISIQAKTPALLRQTLLLSEPVQRAIRKSAQAIYCREMRTCTGTEGGPDKPADPATGH